ncbi:MAG: septum formation protein Maf [Calditrichaeota bacterium]|nr:MAG: septum formation protein Maf [Calditrichota bacterium]MBL1206933.1 septum formation protein Maf [Calditrichota bacterium]NOG46760.1 septum formation protein Maf [Calditrichota bacterium]
MIFSLITNLEHLDVILASASPRRYELLASTGIQFKVIPSSFDESSVDISDPILLAEEIAHQKGLVVAREYPQHLVISADTIVTIGDNIFGKPKNEQHAAEMLQALSGKSHKVHTAFGLFLLKYDKSLIETCTTEVTMRDLHNDEIMAYVNTGEPMDKAGAYAIQGQGAMLVEKINGAYSNVVGFPLAKFFTTLDHFLANLALQE